MSAIKEMAIDKSTWGDGPWQSEPDRVDFVHAGFACLALRHPEHGNWCGYVAVPREHPAYGVKPLKKDLDLDVHRGLNYGAKCSGLICHVPQPGMPDDVWWLGFDCGHSFDLCPGREARFRSTVAALALAALRTMPPHFAEVYRPLPYVRAEIEGLAEQLAAMANHT